MLGDQRLARNKINDIISVTCHGGGNEIRPAISKRSLIAFEKTRGPDTMLSELEDKALIDMTKILFSICDYYVTTINSQG